MSTLELGTEATVEVIVAAEHLAERLALEEGEGFPAVFSTRWLLAQLERAAAKVLRPLLDDGQISVGARASLENTAPKPPSGKVIAHARFTGRQGQLYEFDVWAEDDAGPIGKGQHARAIVPKTTVENQRRSALLCKISIEGDCHD